LGFLNSLPNWSLDEKAAILEIVPLLILIAYFYITEGRDGKARKLTSPDRQRIREKQLDKQFTTKWVQKLPVYQAAMDHEQTIRLGYQALLTTLDIALFGLWFTLYQLNLTMYPWLLALASITLCIIFGIACEFRARNVDVWRRRIVELVSGTDIEDAFKECKYRWIPFGGPGYWGNYVFGHWFERFLIPIMLAVWLYLLWLLANPLLLLDKTLPQPTTTTQQLFLRQPHSTTISSPTYSHTRAHAHAHAHTASVRVWRKRVLQRIPITIEDLSTNLNCIQRNKMYLLRKEKRK